MQSLDPITLILFEITLTVAVFLSISSLSVFLYSLFKSKKQTIFSKPAGSLTESCISAKFIDFDDELKDWLSTIIKSPLQYADPVCGKHLIYHYFNNDMVYNNKRIDCTHVKIRFKLLAYHNGSQSLCINFEKHYGRPHWINKEMTYNYPSTQEDIYIDLSDFGTVWPTLLDKLFIVEKKT